jgi:hypothetical protein
MLVGVCAQSHLPVILMQMPNYMWAKGHCYDEMASTISVLQKKKKKNEAQKHGK